MPEHVKLDEGRLEEWGVEHGPKVIECVRKICRVLFPKFEFRPNFDTLTSTVSLSGASLTPAPKEAKTIVRTIELPAWELSYTKHFPASRFEPEDFDEVPVSLHCGDWDAAASLVKFVISNRIDCFVEAESLNEELAESLNYEG